MTTMSDAIKKALTQKRQADQAAQAEAKNAEREAPPPETVSVKHVGCHRCRETQKYNDFLYHGGTPGFCKCKPGAEDLYVFHLKVEKPTTGELK